MKKIKCGHDKYEPNGCNREIEVIIDNGVAAFPYCWKHGKRFLSIEYKKIYRKVGGDVIRVPLPEKD